jgi:hypothetical protein
MFKKIINEIFKIIYLLLLLLVASKLLVSSKALSALVSLFLIVDSIGFNGVSIIFFFYKI